MLKVAFGIGGLPYAFDLIFRFSCMTGSFVVIIRILSVGYCQRSTNEASSGASDCPGRVVETRHYIMFGLRKGVPHMNPRGYYATVLTVESPHALLSLLKL